MDMHVESLQNLLTSLKEQTTPLAAIPALPALHRGDVIEIQGPASSGKTHLLYHVLLSLLVPVSPSPGAQIAAVVYDTDASFDIQRFRHLLFSRLSRSPSSTPDPQEGVWRTLARLHIFRPTSLIQLAAAIANLPAYHSSHMPDQEIAVLAVDSISAFYWADRLSAEQLRAAAPENVGPTPTLLPFHHVLNAIQNVQRSHGPLTVLTNWALSSAPSCSELLYKQHLHLFPTLEHGIPDLGAKALSNTDHSSSSPFHLAHHIALSSPSSNLSPTAPPDDALHRVCHGKRPIDSGQVYCLARSSGTRDAVRFIFRITNDDILVQPQESTPN